MTQRRFYLNRIKDLSGNSGTGRVAEGCEFSNHVAVVCWQTERYSTTVYQDISDVAKLHGHEGATEVVYIDDENGEPYKSDEALRFSDWNAPPRPNKRKTDVAS
jgi:hypothetical protein